MCASSPEFRCIAGTHARQHEETHTHALAHTRVAIPHAAKLRMHAHDGTTRGVCSVTHDVCHIMKFMNAEKQRVCARTRTLTGWNYEMAVGWSRTGN